MVVAWAVAAIRRAREMSAFVKMLIACPTFVASFMYAVLQSAYMYEYLNEYFTSLHLTRVVPQRPRNDPCMAGTLCSLHTGCPSRHLTPLTASPAGASRLLRLQWFALRPHLRIRLHSSSLCHGHGTRRPALVYSVLSTSTMGTCSLVDSHTRLAYS